MDDDKLVELVGDEEKEGDTVDVGVCVGVIDGVTVAEILGDAVSEGVGTLTY